MKCSISVGHRCKVTMAAIMQNGGATDKTWGGLPCRSVRDPPFAWKVRPPAHRGGAWVKGLVQVSGFRTTLGKHKLGWNESWPRENLAKVCHSLQVPSGTHHPCLLRELCPPSRPEIPSILPPQDALLSPFLALETRACELSVSLRQRIICDRMWLQLIAWFFSPFTQIYARKSVIYKLLGKRVVIIFPLPFYFLAGFLTYKLLFFFSWYKF